MRVLVFLVVMTKRTPVHKHPLYNKSVQFKPNLDNDYYLSDNLDKDYYLSDNFDLDFNGYSNARSNVRFK